MTKKITFLVIGLLVSLISIQAQVSQTEFEGLVALYNATDGDNWNNNTNWDINATANDVTNDWYGLTVEDGHITIIDFYSNNLKNTLPNEIENFTYLTYLNLGSNHLKHLPSEIGNLDNLETLNLLSNDIIVLPENIGNLQNLQNLTITYNNINELPSNIGNLTNLITFNFGGNQISNLPQEISNLINLEELSIYDNPISELTAVINLIALTDLRANNCEIANLPSGIDNLTNLSVLVLENNLITSLPATIENLANLYYLELSNNLFTSFPANICNLTNLTTLKLNSNSISIIPSDIESLINLTNLELNNNQIEILPAEFGNLSSLISLKLSSNLISDLPTEFSNLDNLAYILMSSNSFVDFPIELCNLPSLLSLNLYGNQISNIPIEIGNITTLKELEISKNMITSLPSEISNLLVLEEIRISNNAITSLPNELSNCILLERLIANNNIIEVTTDLSGLSNIIWCEFGYNKLDFGDLETLNLDWTTLSSSSEYAPQYNIPVLRNENSGNITFTVNATGTNNQYQWFNDGEELTGENSNVLNITNTEDGAYYCIITDTNFPELTLQTIPEGVGSYSITNGVLTSEYNALVALYDNTDGDNWYNNYFWKSNEVVDMWYGVVVTGCHISEIGVYGLDGILPSEIENLTFLSKLDLSAGDENNLQLCNELGNLLNLTYLKLSHCDLSGSFPSQILNLINLETINLSYNSLSGEIPTEINNLTSLIGLNVDNNSFSSFPNSLSLSNLKSLSFRDNQITELPNLDNLIELIYLAFTNNQVFELPELSALINLKLLLVAENNLTFEDIEPNIEVPAMIFSYSPQAKVGEVQEYNLNTGDNLTISVSVGGDNNIYQWCQNDIIIDGANEPDYMITNYSDNDAGIYVCKITNTVATSLELISHDIGINTPVVDIDKIEKNNSFLVYPNPVKNILNITTENQKIKQIAIIDITGKIIFTKTEIQQNEMIDLSNFESGIYIIKIQTDNEIFTTKIVKE